MRWCFDTSALIEPWVRLYPPDLFAPIWQKLTELCEAGDIVAPIDVLHELEKQKDDLHDWAESEANEMFLDPDRRDVAARIWTVG
ncbi:DUF4411 family protein [Burkholderia humptydooensis]|uniref:DUF4411 family protein n=2 Tax=Burkholderia humptydooensis TaxID=430531 RepID=A0A7T2WX63_9BURK|nr:DUF4411 family protein [Burkholderia humptydooensis]